MTAAIQLTKGKNMKKIVLSIALACVAPFAWGQVSETTTTTTTTDASGTITEYSPGSAIVLKETSGPRHYRFGKSVTYVTRSGKVLDEDVVKTRVKVGVPVRVHYTGTGDAMMVDRVILDEDLFSLVRLQRAFLFCYVRTEGAFFLASTELS